MAIDDPALAAEISGLGLDPNTSRAVPLREGDRPLVITMIEVDDALATWDRLRRLPERRWWPVFSAAITEDEEPEGVLDLLGVDDETVEQILQRAERIDVAHWLAAKATELDDDFEDDDERGFLEFKRRDYKAARKAEKRRTDRHEPGAFQMLSGERKETVDLLLVPATDGWQVPAQFNWQSVNYDIGSAEHVAILKSWNERLGADLIGLSIDQVELHLDTPITDQAALEEICREHYLYCPDVIEQGCETMGALVADREGNRFWWFWWD